jgi:hypothetical protein
MKSKLPRFTARMRRRRDRSRVAPIAVVASTTTLLLSLAWAAPALAQPAASSPAAPLDAKLILADARRYMARHRTVSAKVRQQTNLFGVHQVGSGMYVQQTEVGQTKIRFELKVQADNKLQTFLQVADGRYLWTQRQASDQQTISRVSLHRVAQELGQPSEDEPRQRPLPAIGGLGELLASLDASFDFRAARPDTLTDLPVYVLTGVWSQRELRRMLPDQREAIQAGQQPDLSQLGEQIPHEVEIKLGRDDLFPYVIDYRRLQLAAEERGGGARPRYESLVSMQLFEVRLGGPVDTRAFVFKPGEEQFVDRTESYIKQLALREKILGADGQGGE